MHVQARIGQTKETQSICYLGIFFKDNLLLPAELQ